MPSYTDTIQGPLRHPRPLTAADLHMQLEKEQEAVVSENIHESPCGGRLMTLRTQRSTGLRASFRFYVNKLHPLLLQLHPHPPAYQTPPTTVGII